MTAPETDGGRAFPCSSTRDDEYGMTLRDWFAGQALTVLTRLQGVDDEQIAKNVYGIADAMLKERAKP